MNEARIAKLHNLQKLDNNMETRCCCEQRTKTKKQQQKKNIAATKYVQQKRSRVLLLVVFSLAIFNKTDTVFKAASFHPLMVNIFNEDVFQ